MLFGRFLLIPGWLQRVLVAVCGRAHFEEPLDVTAEEGERREIHLVRIGREPAGLLADLAQVFWGNAELGSVVGNLAVPFVFLGFEPFDEAVHQGGVLFRNTGKIVEPDMEVVEVQHESFHQAAHEFRVEMMLRVREPLADMTGIIQEGSAFLSGQLHDRIPQQGQLAYHIVIVFGQIVHQEMVGNVQHAGTEVLVHAYVGNQLAMGEDDAIVFPDKEILPGQFEPGFSFEAERMGAVIPDSAGLQILEIFGEQDVFFQGGKRGHGRNLFKTSKLRKMTDLKYGALLSCTDIMF